MKRVLLIVLISLFTGGLIHAAIGDNKKSLSVDDIVKWNRITDRKISDNGKFISVIVEPWKGTSNAMLLDMKGNKLFQIDSVKSTAFTPAADFFIINRAGKKIESLIIYNIKSGKQEKIDSVSKFMVMPEWGSWIILSKKDSTLFSYNLVTGRNTPHGKVSDWIAAENAIKVLVSTKDKVVLISPDENTEIITGDAKKVKKLAISKDGKRFAWLSAGEIVISSEKGILRTIKKGESVFPEGWRIPDNSQLSFSEKGIKLYFSTAPAERKRDSSAVSGEWPGVQVWSWKEGIPFTKQVIDKDREKKRTYQAVYDIPTSSLVQLGLPTTERIITADKGDGDWVLTASDNKYRLEEMWTGRSRYDVHITNSVMDRSVPVASGVNGNPSLSPKGNWVYWYSYSDSSWYVWSVSAIEGRFVTSPAKLAVHEEDNDLPDWPSSYGIAGWNQDESELYLYDRYDIWKVDPLGKIPSERITMNGREMGITYRIEKIDTEKQFIERDKDIFLSIFDNKTKEGGYAVLDKGFKKEPVILTKDKCSYSGLIKSKKADVIIYSKENYENSPDLYLSDLSFKKEFKLTTINPQQTDFLWGTAELVSWVSIDGVRLEGVVYKPANFDPSKKYPLIVNFYEKNSSTLYGYRTPEAHRSTIDYHMYNSHGYVVFNPDIVYKDGYPGESGFNAIMPGISALIQQGWVDEKAIGGQGHSWGGYQVAYLATRTNLFAAIESGAPVVNMFSAYGGIRWGTGLNRSFQYEHQQSRIGATPWEAHQRYIENSPLFSMDKVTTPILIMHNDQDGHVPWYQGIEYFVALKRLQKPVWLLNYSGEVHWPQKIQNKMDFQKRMMQFFDHYLRGKEAPKWMEDDLSAIDLDFELGY